MDKQLEKIFEKYTINNVLTPTSEMLDEIIEYEYETNQLDDVFYHCEKNSERFKILCNIRKSGMIEGFKRVMHK